MTHLPGCQMALVASMCLLIVTVSSILAQQQPQQQQVQLPTDEYNRTPETQTSSPILPSAKSETKSTKALDKTSKRPQSLDRDSPASPGAQNTRAAIEELPSSMVDVAKAENKRKVDVHVPIVFDMTNHDDGEKSKLDLSVLSGLVTVNREKARQADGQISGPLTVSVFGIPIYSGSALKMPPSLFGENRTLSKSSSESSDRNVLPGNELYSAVRRSNERFLGSLSGMLSQLASLVGQQAVPISNINGKPADSKDGYVMPSKFSKSDKEPKSQSSLSGGGTR